MQLLHKRVGAAAPRARPTPLPQLPSSRRRAAAPAAAAPTSGAAGVAAAASQQQQHLALHLGETTLQVPFSAEQGRTLDAALAKLIQTFAEKQAATRPRRWDMMEVRFTGEEAHGLELLEIFSNPNSASSAFDAKLLITARAAGGALKVTGEARLSAIKADLDAFLSAAA